MAVVVSWVASWFGRDGDGGGGGGGSVKGGVRWQVMMVGDDEEEEDEQEDHWCISITHRSILNVLCIERIRIENISNSLLPNEIGLQLKSESEVPRKYLRKK